jgi:hypothetical protein
MVEHNDFLQRFLERRGPGPHHLTFKVPDIEAAIEQAEANGFPVINVDLSEDDWKEAFVHPKAAHGILVQLAQAAGDMPGVPPSWFPTPNSQPAELLRVVHAVASLDDALGLFRALLGGHEVDTGDDSGRWVELTWKEPGLHVRLWQPDDDGALDGQAGRVQRLELRAADGRNETVEAAGNFGVELRFVDA